jgi:hypothetical protein
MCDVREQRKSVISAESAWYLAAHSNAKRSNGDSRIARQTQVNRQYATQNTRNRRRVVSLRIGQREREHRVDARKLVALTIGEKSREIRGTARHGVEPIERGRCDQPRFARPAFVARIRQVCH